MTPAEVILRPIGVLHTPFAEPVGGRIQPVGDEPGRAEVAPEYAPGLADLDGFSHLILLYHFHLGQGFELKVTPFLDDAPRGLFATRAPRRPNPLGLSVVRLTGVQGNVLHLAGVDMVDGSPLLDIKPFVPQFDAPRDAAIGWLSGKVERAGRTKADDRFRD